MIMYGNYAAQPLIGFLERREGILGSARFKINPNWVLLGAMGYDIHHKSLTQTQVGIGYIDDCLILALNYITSYAYSGSVTVNHSYMMQLSLRTLGGTTSTQTAGVPVVNPGVFGAAH
jgi:LPS-assembly protein